MTTPTGTRTTPGTRGRGSRLLVPSAALLWGLQFAFLNPALALLLVALFHATPAQVGTVLAVYNASGFVASLALPAYADRRGSYLGVMAVCGGLTLALAAVLALATSLPVAVLALVVLGGPAGVGSALLFAELRHAGGTPGDVVRTRAIFSFAWVAGPPIATVVLTASGPRALVLVVGAVALAATATVVAMARARTSPAGTGTGAEPAEPSGGPDDGIRMSRVRIGLIVGVFVVLQATNNAVIAVMALYVTQSLGLAVTWAGLALGVAAALEIPALLLIGRLEGHVPALVLVAGGCLLGMAYYAAMTVISGPVVLLAMQVLNAGFFAVVAGVGITLFQEVIPRPGLASGLYTNTRRVGAIISGPIVAVAGLGLGYRGVFAACAVLTAAALAVVVGLARGTRHIA